jgi:uncharacterized Zn finger protein (UPF0148 family)
MTDFLFCAACGYDTPHYKTRNGSWFTWTCSVCGARSDDTPANKEQREAVKRQHQQEKALLDATLTDLSNQLTTMRTALHRVISLIEADNTWEPLAEQINLVCRDALR